MEHLLEWEDFLNEENAFKDPVLRKLGWPVLSAGQVNLKTGKNQYFDLSKEDKTAVLINVKGKSAIILGGIGDYIKDTNKSLIYNDQTGTVIGNIKIIDQFDLPGQLEELKDKAGVDKIPSYVFK